MLNQVKSDITHDTSRNRFVLNLGEDEAFITYNMQGDTLYLLHSEVPAHLRGGGIGKQLVDKTFMYIQEHQLKAVALCSYIQLIRDRNPAWRNLIG
ncbi:MAG: GNAT family N-acetyltransferase [Bacteroidia bacterium]|nr:GNAT family N-acetyltransferase [Bacteroidia bacterium]